MSEEKLTVAKLRFNSVWNVFMPVMKKRSCIHRTFGELPNDTVRPWLTLAILQTKKLVHTITADMLSRITVCQFQSVHTSHFTKFFVAKRMERNVRCIYRMPYCLAYRCIFHDGSHHLLGKWRELEQMRVSVCFFEELPLF